MIIIIVILILFYLFILRKKPKEGFIEQERLLENQSPTPDVSLVPITEVRQTQNTPSPPTQQPDFTPQVVPIVTKSISTGANIINEELEE